MLFVLFHPLSLYIYIYVYIFIRTHTYISWCLFPAITIFSPHFASMSLPGQVGIGLRAKRSTQRRMRSFSQWRTDVHGQSTGGALHANGKRFISLDDRSGRGAVNFRELPMRGHHLSLWSLFCIPSFQLRQRYFIENVGCDRRSRFESWYHVEICIHVEFEIGEVSFKLGKVEKETRSPSFGIFVSRIFFKVNNSFFHLNSKQRISRLDQSTRSKYTSDSRF